MVMKAMWKGSLSFGLVSIPVELYTAVQPHAFGFTVLHATCHTPLHYYRWCEHCKKDVSWENTVKGIKLADGTYFIITKEALADLKPEKSDQLSLIACIDAQSIDPLYQDQHYYLVPAKVQEKAYYLLHAALIKIEKIIIARGIFKDKEHVCLIQPYQDIFILTTLNYTYEIKTKPQLEHKAPALDAKERALAEQLLMKWYTKKLDLSKFKDTFADELVKLIERSKKTKKRAAPKKQKKAERRKTTAPPLLAALKESLAMYEQQKSAASKRAR